MRARAVLAVSALVAALVALVASPAQAAPANDARADAAEIGSLPFDDARSTVGATQEVNEPVECAGAATIWYRYTPAAEERVRIDTAGSDFDTVVAVYTESASGLTLVDCNDDNGGLQARLDVELTAGTTYFLQVGGFAGDTGNLVLSVALAPPAGFVSGTVTDEATGEPLEFVCVGAWTLDGNWFGDQYTGADGTYEWALDPGDYKIDFYPCGTPHQPEWWDNRMTFEEADVVTVVEGVHLAGTDASLTPYEFEPPSPVDMAVTDLSVEAHPIRTDAGDTGLYTGWVRTVQVDVADLTDPAWYETEPTDPNAPPAAYPMPVTESIVTLRSCPRTAGPCQTIGWERLSTVSGETASLSFKWNGLGQIGDVTLEAEAHACGDVSWDNNLKALDHFVVAGGLDAGVGVRGGSEPPWWFYDCGYWY